MPEYWNPPSLFELAQRTGFDIESLIFSFALGGIGAVLYNALTKRPFGPVSAAERSRPLHRFHSVALWLPYVLFVPLYFVSFRQMGVASRRPQISEDGRWSVGYGEAAGARAGRASR